MINTTTSQSNNSSNKDNVLPSGNQPSPAPNKPAIGAVDSPTGQNVTPNAPEEDKPWLKMLEHYNAYSQKPEQRGRGPRSIGEIMQEMFGPIEDHPKS